MDDAEMTPAGPFAVFARGHGKMSENSEAPVDHVYVKPSPAANVDAKPLIFMRTPHLRSEVRSNLKPPAPMPSTAAIEVTVPDHCTNPRGSVKEIGFPPTYWYVLMPPCRPMGSLCA